MSKQQGQKRKNKTTTGERELALGLSMDNSFFGTVDQNAKILGIQNTLERPDSKVVQEEFERRGLTVTRDKIHTFAKGDEGSAFLAATVAADVIKQLISRKDSVGENYIVALSAIIASRFNPIPMAPVDFALDETELQNTSPTDDTQDIGSPGLSPPSF